MKINFGTGRKPSSNTDQISQLRRKLLMGCAWLPVAPLLAMLGGCNEGDTPDAGTSTFRSGPEVPPANQSLNIGLPPYKTTDILPPPPNQKTDAQTTVEVTHIPEQPPAPSKPKKVGIYSLQIQLVHSGFHAQDSESWNPSLYFGYSSRSKWHDQAHYL